MPVIPLYGDITEDSGRAIIEAIAKAGAGEIILAVNSGGGDVFTAVSVYNAIRRHGRVVARIDGIAASAASLVVMAAKKIIMAAGSRRASPSKSRPAASKLCSDTWRGGSRPDIASQGPSNHGG
jgi:ATP-dependent protease ClpP protease subunit